MTARRWILVLGALALVAAGVLLADDALARVGGGQNFGRRPSGGGGGFSGGGGGGGDGVPIELVYLLVQLVIRYPAIGIPLVLVVIGVLVVRGWAGSGGGDPRVERTRRALPPAVPVVRAIPGLAALRGRDPGFSLPVLLDFVVLVHRRALEAVGNGAWEPLAPYVADAARDRLLAAHPGVGAISEVVAGGVRVLKVEQRHGEDHLVVRIESTRLEHPKQGEPRRVLVDELWTFRRAAGATSPPPERIERLGCPSCGAAIEVGPMGECRNCGSPITRGQLQWQVVWVDVRSRSEAIVPSVTTFPGGEEPSVHVPTVSDPGLDRAMAELRARHPEFDVRPFGQRIRLVYHELQKAWSAGRWADARPYVTDRMYQALRFWLDRYAKGGLRNVLEDVSLDQVQIVKIDLDAYYTSITVRIWGAMKDAVVDAKGDVVGGSPHVTRKFSEYWTFVRSADAPADTKGGAVQCPSCGAPLDRVDQAGVCGYCDSKITSGRFDWVLARIEQPEAYGG